MPGRTKRCLNSAESASSPGLVDENLFNEHVARYHFAARFLPAGAARVLDAGCGSGYGAAHFGPQASVIGVDIAHEAVSHARDSFSRAGVSFAQASCESRSLSPIASFDLVVAFEVIEHLERWRICFAEAARVVKTGRGVFLGLHAEQVLLRRIPRRRRQPQSVSRP